ncbi:hypothetical protein [Pontibacter sp. G13]|uniref:hypothetical protein n=1 Tax=Pontibacter sp. G13 TaxID=3074898 RepID=UPI00288BAE39|nr:hypothetical protein [Pontibacter sp. G13]WNJ20640.1 hypothetical protein RJD25_09160 [Pontibacter sp. G13]
MRVCFTLLIGLFGISLQSFGQIGAGVSPGQLSVWLDEYRDLFRTEKVYIHTDKPYYVLGDTLWFSTYLRDSYTLQKSGISQSLYVELIDPDGKILETRNLYQDSTHCHGNFELSKKSPPGRYRLRGYTSWLRNYGDSYFFEQEVRVYPLTTPERTGASAISASNDSLNNYPLAASEAPDVQFFPEGGTSVLGIPCRVGVKLLEPSGYGAAFHATLFDSLGQEVLHLEGNKLGMGSFSFTPEYLSGYYVLLQDGDGDQAGQKYSLPASTPTGGTLTLLNLEDQVAQATISFGAASQNQGGSLLIVSRKQVIGRVAIPSGRAAHKIDVPLDQVREGIVRFILFDHLDRPLAERLLFCYHQPAAELRLDAATYKSREKVELTLSLTDHRGQALKGKASLAVVDNQLVKMGSKSYNIISELLISPELKGEIETPGWYFRNYDDQKREALDHLMLTQGWRNHHWLEDLKSFSGSFMHIPEKGITISGETRGLVNQAKIQKSKVTMISTKGSFQYNEVITSDSGKFAFTGMVFFDSVNLVFQAYKYNDRRQKATQNRNVSLILLEQIPPKVIPLPRVDPNTAFALGSTADYVREQKILDQIRRTFSFDISLDTVSITATANEVYSSESADLQYRASLDSIPGGNIGTIWEYLTIDPETYSIMRDVEETQIGLGLGLEDDETSSSGSSGFGGANFLPVWLDGFQLTEQDAKTIPIASIGVIEVLNSPIGASSTATPNGAIMLYTKEGGDYGGSVVRGINGLKHPGFWVAKEFYKPVYEPQASKTNRPDRRITLHWEPCIYFDEEGQAELSFFTDDKSTSYTIQVEGISEDGVPFVQTLDFVNE